MPTASEIRIDRSTMISEYGSYRNHQFSVSLDGKRK